jgi:hypothetical protein
MPTKQITPPDKSAQKTYFGIVALITSVLSTLSLLANYTVANMNISADTFSKLNNLTALLICIFTPLAFALGVLGYTRKNDSKKLSLIAIILVTVPFLIIFTQFVYYLMK